VIFGFVWWLLILGAFDFLVLGWLVRPHYRGDNEDYWPGWALAWALIITTVILWLGGINLPVLVWQNPMNAFVGVLAYAGIGIVWSVIHWTLWRGSERQRERLSKAHASWKKFLRPENADTVEAFRASGDYPYGWDKDFAMILTWVLFWPLDIIFYVLGDFIFNLALAIGRKLAGIYSAIGKGIDRSVIGE
jgi:hypothetical protein